MAEKKPMDFSKKAGKSKKNSKSLSLEERIERARKAYKENVDDLGKSLDDLELDELKDLYKAIPKGMYKMGTSNIKGIKNVIKAFMGLKDGGLVKNKTGHTDYRKTGLFK